MYLQLSVVRRTTLYLYFEEVSLSPRGPSSILSLLPRSSSRAYAVSYLCFLPLIFRSEIYCHGNLLHTVQMARLFNDSKHFVDMSLKASPNDTLRAFQDLMNETGNKPSKEQVRAGEGWGWEKGRGERWDREETEGEGWDGIGLEGKGSEGKRRDKRM